MGIVDKGLGISLVPQVVISLNMGSVVYWKEDFSFQQISKIVDWKLSMIVPI